MTIPFFTVIMCTYQRADLIGRALDSLLAQSETDWEAIVVDDGSTDDTVHIVQRYGDADGRIRLICKSHGGCAAARNAGIEEARGLFITFLDSDDEYNEHHLSSRRSLLLAAPDVLFLHGGAQVIGDEWVVDKNDTSKKIHLSECVIGGTFVVRRSLFGHIGKFDVVPYAEDALFYDRVANSGVLMASTDHPTYIYHRDHPNTLTNTHGKT